MRLTDLRSNSADKDFSQLKQELEATLASDFNRLKGEMNAEVRKTTSKWDSLKASNARKTAYLDELRQTLHTDIERNLEIREDNPAISELRSEVNRKDEELQLIELEMEQLDHLLARTKREVVGCKQLRWKQKLSEIRTRHRQVTALTLPVGIAGMKAEHQALHSCTLAYNQRVSLSTARTHRTHQIQELHRVKDTVHARIDSLTSSLTHRELRNRVPLTQTITGQTDHLIRSAHKGVIQLRSVRGETMETMQKLKDMTRSAATLMQ